MPFQDKRKQFTLDAIRQRMAQHIMHLWGVKNLQSLDPFVRLVMDALASELNKLSQEFIDSEAGLLDRLASLLTPDLLTVPRPAHAVVQVQPADPVAYIAPTESLFYTKRFASKPYGELDTRHDLFLSAVDTVKLFQGRVAWLAAGETLFRLDPALGKLPEGFTGQDRKLPAHTFWLGVALHPDITSLDRLGFYLELPHVLEAETLFNLLHLSHWSLNSQPLDMRPGLCYDPQPGENNPLADDPRQLLAGYSIDQLLEQDVKNTYHNRFMHLRRTGNIDLAALTSGYPATFAEHFSPETLELLRAEPMLWLQVTLPANFNETVLSQLTVRLNALPVMNRRLRRLTYRTRVMHNILPLPVGQMETFLTVRTLLDSRNRVFTAHPLRQADQVASGSYSVRRSGIERFDARDAREQLHYLLEVLRDESVAFAAYGHDTVQLEAQRLTQQINQLERLLTQQEGAVRELPHYLLVQPYEEADTLEVSYWTTDCEYGNNLQAGTALQPYDITYLLGSESILLTTSTGGQNRRGAASQLEAYRYALMSHERLVTSEDIRSFVLVELGHLLTDVSIRRGVMVGDSAKQGFIRTIDVCLTPAPDCMLREADWEVLCAGLKTKLVSRSGQVSPYRIIRLEPA
ncbi:type VI secretion system baseplate subunit TssF [Hymenobacter crusticola]|uniref:Type VI secretion system baseplate subunit TssF n=1 Tax=Hymenobacter crusticola TaxID=1770526 RepID=A0A243WIG6_9BACT|nr:type VI secretion system baseplate subunit TssF [Hymenobacter crusticola]OUJ74799.1 hypothetical protein BXP70_08570 [Hymenobacter crusticola]